MMKCILGILFCAPLITALPQQKLEKLTVEKIMRDPKWIGTSPSNPYWSIDGKYLLFSWNPDQAVSDSVYYISTNDLTPKKSVYEFRQELIPAGNVMYNVSHTAYSYSKDGDVYLFDLKTKKERRITQTLEIETNAGFLMNDTKIAFLRNLNVYAWDIASGLTTQLTNFQRSGAASAAPQPGGQRNAGARQEERSALSNNQEKWLAAEQLRTSEVLKTRKEQRDLASAALKMFPKSKQLRTIVIDDKNLSSIVVSPDARFITYRLFKPDPTVKNTIVPNYITETGFTTDIPGRTKVGYPIGVYESYIFDMEKDTVLPISLKEIPGIYDAPDYMKDYPARDSSKNKNAARGVTVSGPYWNDQGTNAVVEIYSHDSKDRWLMLLDATTGKLKPLDRQRDEAWIGGPGISEFNGSKNKWIDENTYWYQSEVSGYSHLYLLNVKTAEKTALTSGKYEVQEARLSYDKKSFYIRTNEIHPGEQQFYRLSVKGGKAVRITTMTGANLVTISPDEKQIAILYSYSNKPWELYLQENKPGGKLSRVTYKSETDEFKSYAWKDPELITFTARDGEQVYARVYKPVNPGPAKPAVMFVHGAGYLQNAHKWWSSYFREYMFNNLLADNGYTVMDIDYRGSAGYGRNWRTGIYRYMGGKDLSDELDGAKYMVDKLGVDPKHIGLYGGSYGGFMTLMAMFTAPDVFAAGGALRSVTDWAHYNDGYTSNILNDPFTDSIAYQKSSPINFASGLKGHLLMCHGMVDVNVHFQDIVRLTQRLIELGKDNWELAVYPMEDHGFVEPSSWTDEYKRVFKLFETYLK